MINFIFKIISQVPQQVCNDNCQPIPLENCVTKPEEVMLMYVINVTTCPVSRCVTPCRYRTAASSPRAPSVPTSQRSSADRRPSSSLKLSQRQSATGDESRREQTNVINLRQYFQIRHLRRCFSDIKIQSRLDLFIVRHNHCMI